MRKVLLALCLHGPAFLHAAAFAEPPLLISEFRLSGPNGPNDEFVEIYNQSDSPHVVAAPDGSAGYAVAKSGSGGTPTNGVTCFVISNGTVIPAYGHFLGVGTSYSLNNYPAGNRTTAVGNATNVVGIEDDVGIALFRTANPANFVLSNRLDAVGSTAETNSLYRQGSGCGRLLGSTLQFSFSRNFTNGTPIQ